jgi:xanthine dehydrogenase accessory factor
MHGAVMGDRAVMGGWLARAQTLLGDDRDSLEAGWVALSVGMFSGDRGVRESRFREALALAERHQDTDLALVAQAYLGASLVHDDRVDERMALLDDALAAASGNETDDFFVLSDVFCQLFAACEHAHDVCRADQWIRVGEAVAARRRLPAVAMFCRTHYGGILTAAGRWDEADAALRDALRLWNLGYRSLGPDALIRLADLRVRQGRFEEAEGVAGGLRSDRRHRPVRPIYEFTTEMATLAPSAARDVGLARLPARQPAGDGRLRQRRRRRVVGDRLLRRRRGAFHLVSGDVYGLALSVIACLRAGTHVDVAWLVDPGDFVGLDPADAVAVTPGGGRIGSLLAGALDDQLVELAGRGRASGRLVSLTVSDVDALVAGLPGGGDVRCLVVAAETLPVELWDLLLLREPVGLVTRLDGDEVIANELLTPGQPDAGGGREQVSEVVIDGETVTTTLWPVSTLLVVGSGVVADALEVAAAPLGWHVEATNDSAIATGTVASLSAIDMVVVAAHDLELAGAVLAAALASEVGYIGALGGRRMQQARADWLAYRGITDLDRVCAPAGLDIGADTPAEIAIAILAEALSATRRRPVTRPET